MELDNNGKILIAGTGKSGLSAARMILDMGGRVVLYNTDAATDPTTVLSGFSGNEAVELITGVLYAGQLRDVAACVISPGIPLTADFVKVLDKAGIPVIGELEMAWQASKGRMCAITGTNGKTTTTTMTGLILKKWYNDVHVVGNIGVPFSEEALMTNDDSVTAVEVSSFMLETIMNFHPHVSAILNITPDHLDRHGSMKNYIRCKEAITFNQTEDDYVVLNYDDEELRRFGKQKKLRPHTVWFSSVAEPEGEALFLRDGKIVMKLDGTEEELIDVSEMSIIGRHNYENSMAAAAIALKMGVPAEKVREGLIEFRAVEHRIEFVRERCGVRYYNDSKGTNTDASIQALNAMPGPTLLIGGGYDKGSDFDEWVSLFPGKVRYLVLLGQTRDKISECCRKYGFKDIIYADDMEEAVKTCASYADEGDYVLLSPACASWGMFKNYEERGRIFKNCVNAL